MNTEEIKDLAIERHDIDADHFQSTYSQNLDFRANVFLYGRQQILEELDHLLSQLPPDARVLDVGSGTGHLTKHIQDKGLEVVGLEPSKEMLKHARSNFPEIEFTEGISSRMPFDDCSFDLIVAFEVLRYLDSSENEDSYKEFERVLSARGKIFVTHVNRFALDFYFVFHPLNGFLYKLKGTPHHHCHFTTAKAEKKKLTKYGFTSVEGIGRLAASVRIAYKLGKGFAQIYISAVEFLIGNQRFTGLRKNLAGHLLIIAQKQATQK